MKRRSVLHLALGFAGSVAAMPSPAGRTARLTHLRESLRELYVARPTEIDRHIARTEDEIETGERALRTPFVARAPHAREDFERDRLMRRAEASAARWTLLRDVRRRLAGAEDLAVEARSNLDEWRAQLERDLAASEPPAREEDADSERQARWRAERGAIERRIADLRADLRFWSEQRSGAGAPGRRRRAEYLRAEIRAEERASVPPATAR